MKRILAATLAVIALVMPSFGSAQEVVLRAISGHPVNSSLGSDFKLFMDMLNQAGKGVVQIRLIGGPEVTPPSQQGAALANGLADILHLSPIWYAGRFPEGEVFSGKMRAASDVRNDGGEKIFDQALRKKMSATFLAFADGDGGLYVFVNGKPGKRADGLPDLGGLKFRGTTISQEFLSRLGAGTVVLPAPETYTALERGMVNGAVYPIGDAYDLGWQRHLKSVITPAPYGGSTVIIANAAKFDGLSEKAKEVLSKTSVDYEAALRTKYQKNMEESLRRLDASGVEQIALDAPTAEKWRAMAAESYKSYLKAKTFDLDFDKTFKIFAGY